MPKTNEAGSTYAGVDDEIVTHAGGAQSQLNPSRTLEGDDVDNLTVETDEQRAAREQAERDEAAAAARKQADEQDENAGKQDENAGERSHEGSTPKPTEKFEGTASVPTSTKRK